MEKEILKITVRYLLLLILLISCNKKPIDKEAYEIDKAIELVHTNKSINDTLLKFKQKLGVEFIPCIIITTDKYRILGFQIVQSKVKKSPPLKIDPLFKIRNVQGIDVLFVSTEKGSSKKYDIKVDSKTEELIEKGYVTLTGPSPLINSKYVNFVFCKDDDSVFKALTSDFFYKEEMKARTANKSFVIENYYPKCH